MYDSCGLDHAETSFAARHSARVLHFSRSTKLHLSTAPSGVVSSQDDNRLVIQRLCASAKGTERGRELRAEGFGGAAVERAHHIYQIEQTEFRSSGISGFADAVAV